jgi:hypothetical protein
MSFISFYFVPSLKQKQMTKKNYISLVDKIIAFENGDMDTNQVLEFFGELIKTGLAWNLQGSYGRTAVALIDEGFLDKNGNILNNDFSN